MNRCMRKLVFIAMLAMLPLAGIAQKRITGSVEIMPNYLWHMFAASNLWDKPENPYGDKYGHTIPETDRQFLYDNREHIAWANSQGGMLAGGMFFVPLQSETTIERYIAFLEEATATVPDSFVSLCKELIRIMRDNYPRFEREVWPLLEPDLEKAKAMIEARFSGTDPIAMWETNLGLPYPGEKKELVLTYANHVGLPSANDLGPERNNFGIIPDERAVEWVYQTVLHEIGIYIIMPTIKKLMADTALQTDFLLSGNIVYVAFETFAEKRKDEIFGGERRVFLPQWEAEYRWFYDYYLKHDFAGADPEPLLRAAIAEFVANSR